MKVFLPLCMFISVLVFFSSSYSMNPVRPGLESPATFPFLCLFRVLEGQIFLGRNLSCPLHTLERPALFTHVLE